jgi:short-subunit dehydrogenase
MQGFLESLRVENLKNKLHVLIACPGFTSSNIRNTALDKDGLVQSESPRDEKQMMGPDQVAKYIYQSVKKRQNSLVLTMNGKLTVFLNKLFPKLVDRLVFNHLNKEPNSPF